MAHVLFLTSCALQPLTKPALPSAASPRQGPMHSIAVGVEHLRVPSRLAHAASSSPACVSSLCMEWRLQHVRSRGTTMLAANTELVKIWGPVLAAFGRSLMSILVFGGFFLSRLAMLEWFKPKLRSRRLLNRFKVPSLLECILKEYVERTALEARITEHVSHVSPCKYLVVVGPRGCGKSTMIRKVLAERHKVVYLDLGSEFQTIAKKLHRGLKIPQGEEPPDLDLVLDAFRPFVNLKGVEKPVLVVEIDSNVDEETARWQCTEMKRVCVDERLVHGIIVLDDAKAICKLKHDPARQDFLWVDDFNESEMQLFLDKRGVLPSQGRASAASRGLRQRFFNEVGARPQVVRVVTEEARQAAKKAVAALHDHATKADRQAAANEAEHQVFERAIEAARLRAFTDVHTVLTLPPIDQPNLPQAFEQLLRALCAEPAGVDVTFAPFDPLKAAQLIKPTDSRVIGYNMEQGLFQFHTKAHEKATARWFEQELA